MAPYKNDIKLLVSQIVKIKAISSAVCCLFGGIIVSGCTSMPPTRVTPRYNSIDSFLIAKKYIAVPLRRNIIGHLIIKVRINSDTAELVLDTGASATCLEEKSAKKFGIPLSNATGGASGYGGGSDNIKSGTASLTIGTHTLDAFLFSVIDLSNVNSAYSEEGGEQIDGVLGADILLKYNAVIDYHSLSLFLLM